jgi:hypothetical protein
VTFAGLDYDTRSADIVCLELDSDAANWRHISFDLTGGKLDAFERARCIRSALPTLGWWADSDVVQIAIEDPKGPSFRGSVPLARAQGAILASLPPLGVDPPLLEVSSQRWKMACGLGGNCKKQAVQAWVRKTWPNLPTNATQDALDAYAIAWAARALCERAAAA